MDRRAYITLTKLHSAKVINNEILIHWQITDTTNIQNAHFHRNTKMADV